MSGAMKIPDQYVSQIKTTKDDVDEGKAIQLQELSF